MNLQCETNQVRLVLLAPARLGADPCFGRPDHSTSRYDALLASVQRFRGRIYLSDGAITAGDLTPDGRHRQQEDTVSWHVVSTGLNGDILGTARYRPFGLEPRFEDLAVGRSELARSPQWAPRLRKAVETHAAEAAERGVDLAEVGGWAVAEEYRCKAEALRLALSAFALSRILGGCLAFTTATVRHCSAAILRRLGGQHVVVDGVALPRYFDTRYDCEMEILRFDSDQPNPRYASIVELLCADLSAAMVVTPAHPWPSPVPALEKHAPANWLPLR
jgi:hypothetical protein